MTTESTACEGARYVMAHEYCFKTNLWTASIRNIHFHVNTLRPPSGQHLLFQQIQLHMLKCHKSWWKVRSWRSVCHICLRRGMGASTSFSLPSSHGWASPCLSSASPSASSPSASSEVCKVTATPSIKTSASTSSSASWSTLWASTWQNQRYR